MNDTSKWQVWPSLPGETADGKLVRIVRAHVGCSLGVRRAELGALVSRGVDPPERVINIRTNCATTALGVLAYAGVDHPILRMPYQIGMAIAWVRQIGLDMGAITRYRTGGEMPPQGALLRYASPGRNDDHVEWLLSTPDVIGIADHAGGGRGDNAITSARGQIRSSWGRPLVEWIDPGKLGIHLRAAPVPEAAPTRPDPIEVVTTESDFEGTPMADMVVPVPDIAVEQPVTAPPVGLWRALLAYVFGGNLTKR